MGGGGGEGSTRTYFEIRKYSPSRVFVQSEVPYCSQSQERGSLNTLTSVM